MTAPASNDGLMEELVGLCKRRGLYLPPPKSTAATTASLTTAHSASNCATTSSRPGGATWCSAATTSKASIRRSSCTPTSGKLPATSTASPTPWSTARSPSSLPRRPALLRAARARWRRIGYVALVEGADDTSSNSPKNSATSSKRKQSKLDEEVLANDKSNSPKPTRGARARLSAPTRAKPAP